MISFKKYFNRLAALATAAIALTSCSNASNNASQLPQAGFKQPVTVPLTFRESKKINWEAIKDFGVKPVVEKFNLDKLPSRSYDGTRLKPFTYGVEETKFDFNALPGRDLDIDKLPSKPLKFKTFILPPPKLIKAGVPRLIKRDLALYEFGESQSLQGEAIECLFNDRQGFLWIATTRALYRYDGEDLLLYVPSATPDFSHNIRGMLQDPSGLIWIEVESEGLEILDPVAGVLKKTNLSMGLGSNYLHGIIQDKQQRIWMESYSPHGVNIIDPKKHTVKWLDQATGLSSRTQGGGLMQDNEDNIWIASWKGLDVVDLANNKIKYFNTTHGLKSDSIDKTILDHKGNICIGMHSGLLDILNLKKGTLQFIKEAQSPNAYTNDLMVDNKNRIWMATDNNGLEIIDPEKRVAKRLKKSDGLAGDIVNNIKQDDRGQVWIATQTGLNLVDKKAAVVENIGNDPTEALFEDWQGLVWQGTNYTGVKILNRKTKTFKYLKSNNGLGNDTINSIREINGGIFIANNQGLFIVDSLRKTMTHLCKKQGLSNKTVVIAIIDRDGRIWISGLENGIDVYNPKNNRCKHIGILQGLSDSSVVDMKQDRQGRIWASTVWGGIDVIDPGTGVIQYLNNANLQGADTRELLPDDNEDDMWISTKTGVYIADMKNKTLTSFSRPQGLIDEVVISILKHGKRVFAGTNKGISVITPPADNISSGKTWKVESFGNFYGLNKAEVDYQSDMITKDGLYWWGDDGLTVLDISKKDHYHSPAYITGINILDQRRFFTGKAQTVSNGLSWDKVSGPFNTPDNLQLAYNQNYLRFSYGSLNSAIRDTLWYKYRLVGADENWNEETAETSSKNYFSMSPGKYMFELISKNADNLWSKPVTLSFTINPPWWQSWWAYLIYICLFGGSVWGFSHYRSIQLIKDKRALEHKVHIRTEEVLLQKEEIEAQRDNLEKAFVELKTTQNQLIQSEKMASLGELTAGIAHEIQNPLNFVNNFSEVNTELLEEMQEDIEKGDLEEVKAIAFDIRENEKKINMHGKRADSIIKGMLEHSRSRGGQMEPTDLNTLADEFMRLSYHGLRSKDKSFNAELVTNFDPDLPKINVVRQDIGRVLLNLFNNAFYAVNQKQKRAGADYKPEVTVSTSAENGQVVIKVKDNGIGIPDAIKEKIMQPFFTTKPTGEGTGLGLSLTYDMVVKGHGGSIAVDTVEGGFTEFIVLLPLNTAI